MSKRARVVSVILVSTSVLIVAALVFGVVLFVSLFAHRLYRVDGALHVSSPGPAGVELPAVACVWHSMFEGQPRGPTSAPSREGRRFGDKREGTFVLCRVPPGGVDLPLQVKAYGVSGKPLRIGAFLETLSYSHPSCTGDTVVALVSDPYGHLQRVCEESQVPARSKAPTVAPFDDEVTSAPVNGMRIDVYQAE